MTRVPNPILEEIYRENCVRDMQGNVMPGLPPLSPELSYALYNTVLQAKPKVAIEVGMAFGTSTLAILTALAELGGERLLISIDPAQKAFKGIGLANVERAGFKHMHRLIEDYDYFALPDLMRTQKEVGFCYIDGWHTFDYVLLDWFYTDKMLPVGGIVGFNDCGFKSIHKFIKFMLRHRKYEEIDVGLKPDYHGRNLLATLQRKFTGRSGADRYFRKIDTWEPDHNYFHEF